ncbi:MAG: hypothetical protein PHX24_04900 [Acidithiobacillus sp.]|nr:hypothetical protein [Acidithiobacillus sp.]
MKPINKILIPSTDEAWDNRDLGANEAFVGTVKASERESVDTVIRDAAEKYVSEQWPLLQQERE